MNTADVVQLLVSQCELSEENAARVLDALFGTDPDKGIIAGVLDENARITLDGFGTFGVKGRDERTELNKATGEKITISAKKVAYFKPARPLRDRVAKGRPVEDEDPPASAG
ncbi:MAG: nucleoid DNA-binding protein [Myxococcota bacterium]|jgi:nucleoid DNA-binding protein